MLSCGDRIVSSADDLKAAVESLNRWGVVMTLLAWLNAIVTIGYLASHC